MTYRNDGWTIGDVIDKGGALEWRCPDCGGVGRSDPKAISRAKGWTFPLQDQHPPCRTPGCLGRVTFFVGLGMRWTRMETSTARLMALEAAAYREARTLHRHGWRIAGGLWRPPRLARPE